LYELQNLKESINMGDLVADERVILKSDYKYMV
jgi:hypothetical protein